MRVRLAILQLVVIGVLSIPHYVERVETIGEASVVRRELNQRREANLVVEELTLSPPRGFYDSGVTVAIATTTPSAVIRYTTDGSLPSMTGGSLYTAPLRITRTTTLRARAFKDGHAPTSTSTHTYVFHTDLINQVSDSAPPGWPSSPFNGQVLRYGLNPAIRKHYSDSQLIDALRAVPSVSIVTDQSNLTDPKLGIYVNALQRGDGWEREASVEWLSRNQTGFQINSGLRIRGGYSRYGLPKHGFRLFFRRRYGASRLRFPVHGSDGTGEFQTLDLRTEQNYSFANDAAGTENTAVREVFARDLMAALGQPTTRSRPVHLYLNGQYWGLYQTEERPQEDYGASYFGGRADEYDVIQTSNHPDFVYEVASGTVDAWQALWKAARAVAANPTNDRYFTVLGRDQFGQVDSSRPVLVDVDNLIAYMLVHYYDGDGDAPLSNHLHMNQANNWRGIRNRLNRDGFRFFVRDAEHTLLAPAWVQDRVNTAAASNSNRGNFTFSNPEWIHEDLAANPEYRIRFADLAHRALFDGGTLTPAAALAIFDARVAEVQTAILGDVVRWGQSETAHSLSQWQARIATIRSQFFPGRTTTLLAQLRARGLYSSLDAPALSRRQDSFGVIVVTITRGPQPVTIYYTLDGSDPRLIGGAVSAQALGSAEASVEVRGARALRARTRDRQGTWSALSAVSLGS